MKLLTNSTSPHSYAKSLEYQEEHKWKRFRHRKSTSSLKYFVPLLPFILLVLLFELAPLTTVLLRSFLSADGAGITLTNFTSIFQKKLYRDAVTNSMLISLFSALVGIIIAFFGARAANSAEGKPRNIFMSILNMTSNFSGIPLAFSYIIMLGNAGILILFGQKYGIDALANYNLYSFGGLLLIYVYFQVPMATLLLIPSFDGLQKEWREAVTLLGGKNYHFWLKVGIPALLPSLLGTLSVLFSNAVAAYATAYALMGGNFSLLPIRISEQFVGDLVQHKEFGSALAVMLMLLMILVTAVNNYVLKKAQKENGDE